MPPKADNGPKKGSLLKHCKSALEWAAAKSKVVTPATTEPTADNLVALVVKPFGTGVTKAFEKQLGTKTSEFQMQFSRTGKNKDLFLAISNHLRVRSRQFSLGFQWQTLTYGSNDPKWAAACKQAKGSPPYEVYVIDVNAPREADEDAYCEAHSYPSTEWRLNPPSNAKLPANATWKERAIAHFNLPNPFPEEHDEATWKKYYEGRTELEANQDPDDPDFSPENTESGDYRGVIRDAPVEILDAIFPSTIEEGYSGRAVALHDGVLLVDSEGMGNDDWGSSTEGNVVVRVYPPDTLSYVEIAFTSHHRTRYYSVEWSGAMGYRFVPPNPSREPPRATKVFGDSVAQMFSKNGWHPIFWHFLEDNRGPPKERSYRDYDDEDEDDFDEDEDEDEDRTIEHLSVGLTEGEIDNLARFLGIPCGDAISRKRVVQFVLACATISWSPADEVSEYMSRELGGFGGFEWEFSGALAYKLRRAVGLPLPPGGKGLKDTTSNPGGASDYYDMDDDDMDDDDMDDGF